MSQHWRLLQLRHLKLFTRERIALVTTPEKWQSNGTIWGLFLASVCSNSLAVKHAHC